MCARDAMQEAVIAFIDQMKDGEQAAVVKFNDTNPLRRVGGRAFHRDRYGSG